MNHRSGYFIVLLLIFVGISFGEWQTMNEGIPGSFVSIDFIDDNTGWLAGIESGLFKTEDGGVHWQAIPQSIHVQFSFIDFLDKTHGWAVAWMTDSGKSVIMKTTDGGQNWSVKYDEAAYTIHVLSVVNNDTIYGLGYPAIILKTADGGESWIDIAPTGGDASFNSIWFFNRHTGIVIGTYAEGNEYGSLILSTSNGGAEWSERRRPDLYSMNNLKFTQDSIGFFTAQDDSGYVLFCQTMDTCKSWKVCSRSSYYYYDYWARSADTIYAITSELVSISFNQVVTRSIDSGSTWEPVFSLSNWMYTKIYFYESTGFVLGMIGGMGFGEQNSGGILFRSENMAKTWEPAILSYPFSDVYFIDREKGFAVGGSDEIHFIAGDIFETDDGGRTWKLIFSPGTMVTACQFIDDELGFALTRQGFSGGRIFKTEDGGDHWRPVYTGNFDSSYISFAGCDLHFISADTGWAVGSYWDSSKFNALIIGTVDGGNKWYIQWEMPDTETQIYNLNAVSFVNKHNGWAVGDGGLAVKYEAGEGWQKVEVPADLPLKSVSFTDKNTGWIIGSYFVYQGESRSILLKTTNGGQTWDSQTYTDMVIEDIYFSETDAGWAVGFNQSLRGFILFTRDGGEHWETQQDSIAYPLRSLCFKDGHGWAAGDMGLILYTEDSNNWIEGNSNRIYISGYELFQNYPNPFNASSDITFTLPRSEYAELEVFNILGEKVVTLISERLNSGVHICTFNDRNLASGVYYYKLSAGAFSQVRKMVLLR